MPRGRLQKQRKGIMSRVLNGLRSDILLKWYICTGAVARDAAMETARQAADQAIMLLVRFALR